MRIFAPDTWKRAARRGMAALLPACLLSGAAVGVFALLLEIHARNAIPERAAETLQSRLDTATERLDNRLEPLEAQLYLMRDWFRSGSVSPDDAEELNRLCLPVLKRAPWLETMRVAKADGTEWMLAREGAGWLSRRIRAEGGARLSTWTRWDGDGAPIAREERGSTAYDPRDTAWYRGAITHLETWKGDAALAEPALYWHAVDWSAPPESLRVALSLALDLGDAATTVVFEMRPGDFLRSDCIGIAPGGTVAAVPQGIDLVEADKIASTLLASGGIGGAARHESEDGTRWTQAQPYPLAPGLEITLAAVVEEPRLRAVESGLQHAALAAAPLAALVLCLLFLGVDRALPQKRREQAAVAGPSEVPALGEPPQAYLQALDGARKQARRLQAALEAEHKSRGLSETHRRDTAHRTQTGSKTLFDLLASESLWEAGHAPFERFVQAAAQSLVLDWCSVWQMDDDATTLSALACSGRTAVEDEATRTLSRKDFPLLFLAIEVEPVIAAPDAESDPRLEGLAESGRLHPPVDRPDGSHRALLIAPIRLGERRYGALCLERSSRWRKWEADEIAFSQGLAQLLAFRFRIGQ